MKWHRAKIVLIAIPHQVGEKFQVVADPSLPGSGPTAGSIDNNSYGALNEQMAVQIR